MQALPKAEQLQVLNMGDCLVKSGGAKAIADGIRYLKHLKVHCNYTIIGISSS